MEKEEIIQVVRTGPSQCISLIQSRLMEPFYLNLRDVRLARIKSGMVTEDMNLSSDPWISTTRVCTKLFSFGWLNGDQCPA